MVGDWLNALKSFERVVSLSEDMNDPFVASSLTYSAYSFLSIGQIDDAMDVVTKSIEINPYSVAALR